MIPDNSSCKPIRNSDFAYAAMGSLHHDGIKGTYKTWFNLIPTAIKRFTSSSQWEPNPQWGLTCLFQLELFLSMCCRAVFVFLMSSSHRGLDFQSIPANWWVSHASVTCDRYFSPSIVLAECSAVSSEVLLYVNSMTTLNYISLGLKVTQFFLLVFLLSAELTSSNRFNESTTIWVPSPMI